MVVPRLTVLTMPNFSQIVHFFGNNTTMLKAESGFAFVICCTVGNMPQVAWRAGSVSVSDPVARMQTWMLVDFEATDVDADV